MNHFFKLLTIAVAMVIAIPCFAVTDREMEAARTMAAKHYLRYANNGSDYLDKLNPASMSELSGSLKAKEKENLKSFNSVAVPKDYAGWDKARLVEYWSVTFFKSPGLKEDGKKCLGILAKNLNKLTVAAPSAPKAAEHKTPEPTPAAETAPAPDQTTPAAASTPAPEVPADGSAANVDTPEDLAAVADADAGIEDEQPRRSSNTGWYVAILVVLVGVVIWLVMYASKSMKESGSAIADKKESEREIRDTKRAAKEEINGMREQYANSLASKNDEIKQLKAKCESLEAELEESRRELARLRTRAAAASQPQAQKAPAQQARPAGEPAERKATALPPVVYLGYVNQRGLFVKASRSLNNESTVYRMDIPDGHHGTFKVANTPEILDRVLADTGLWLEEGCVIENPQDADIATEIVTVEPGEALFADNTCRVTRKARIKFI